MLRNKVVNGWPLFWLLAAIVCAATVREMLGRDLDDPEDLSHMISFSVRWAVPFIFVVIAASSMPVLFPNDFTKWWARNRKYLGLVFAVAMAWQGAFIFQVSALHTDYYYSDIYFLRDELEGSSGYIFLALMVFTSFNFSRRHLTPGQWKLLHKSGVYFLWAYPFSVYWWNLYYYHNARPIDHLFYVAGFLAFAVRIAAWGHRRRLAAARADDLTDTPLPLKIAGAVLIAGGAAAAVTGAYWQAATTGFLTAVQWSAQLELWLPFWPFEPFLPLMVLALGALCLTHTPRVRTTARGASVPAA